MRHAPLTCVSITIAFLLLSSPLPAENAPGKHDPIAQWLNKHSHEVIEGTLAVLVLVGDHDTVSDAGVTFDGTVASLAAAEGLKLVIHEPRPNDPAATDGFPSSHAASAFAFARGMTDWRNDWGPYVYAFATAVGWARVEEGYHTPEQVLAGAALGFWIAGASIESDGFVINRGSDRASLTGTRDIPTAELAFEGGPSVVLWRQAW